MGDRLWLLHRGTSQEGSNLVAELSLERLMHSLRDDLCLDAGELENIRRYELGDIDGVELTFSDATPIADQLVVFTASAEGMTVASAAPWWARLGSTAACSGCGR